MPDRVKIAYDEKWEDLLKNLKDKHLELDSPVFFRAFKEEKIFEVWIAKADKYELFKSYPICKVPGNLGPKRKEGDMQVPEGVYHITVFNPKSTYFLSLGINYPNASDSIFADKEKPGSEIYIHGDCVSVGCIPLTDNYIKEVYLLAWEAKQKGQKQIPVHIFPFKMNDEKMKIIAETKLENAVIFSFWENLANIYKYFEVNRQVPITEVDKLGRYDIVNEFKR